MINIKRIFTVIIAGAIMMSMGACGKKNDDKSHIVDGEPVSIETSAPNRTQAPSAAPAATVETDPTATLKPFEASSEVSVASGDEMPSEVTEEEFEETDIKEGYTRYVSGDNLWGIILPPGMQPADEDETGVAFALDNNLVMVSVVDDQPEPKTAEEVKNMYSVFGDITIGNFTIMQDGDTYMGCRFDYSTAEGMRGFAKYVLKNGKGVAAAGANLDQTQRTNDLLHEVVDSLVMLN